MVSNVGSAAISAVSFFWLTPSIFLVIQAFYALAAGGTIILPKQAGGGVTFALDASVPLPRIGGGRMPNVVFVVGLEPEIPGF